jgi:hypothetical protein
VAVPVGVSTAYCPGGDGAFATSPGARVTWLYGQAFSLQTGVADHAPLVQVKELGQVWPVSVNVHTVVS